MTSERGHGKVYFSPKEGTLGRRSDPKQDLYLN